MADPGNGGPEPLIPGFGIEKMGRDPGIENPKQEPVISK